MVTPAPVRISGRFVHAALLTPSNYGNLSAPCSTLPARAATRTAVFPAGCARARARRRRSPTAHWRQSAAVGSAAGSAAAGSAAVARRAAAGRSPESPPPPSPRRRSPRTPAAPPSAPAPGRPAAPAPRGPHAPSAPAGAAPRRPHAPRPLAASDSPEPLHSWPPGGPFQFRSPPRGFPRKYAGTQGRRYAPGLEGVDLI